MRKLFTFAFAAALAFTFAACETQNQETAETAQDTVSNEVTPQDPAETAPEGGQAEGTQTEGEQTEGGEQSTSPEGKSE